MKSAITKIQAREILDSRGNPTTETTIWADKIFATTSVPSGISTGSHEAVEIHDNDKKRYSGKGVLLACRNVNNTIAKKVVGMNVLEQDTIDRAMITLDGTENKSKLGANAILSVSMAAARLSAKLQNLELFEYLAKKYGYGTPKMPVPLFNVINGGVHANSGLEIQEFFVIPQKNKFSENLRIGTEVYQTLKKMLAKQKLSTSIGDEGGFAPHLGRNDSAFLVLQKAIKEAGFVNGKDFRLGIDAASSEFYDAAKEKYKINGKELPQKQLINIYMTWCKKFNLEIIEDGLAEDDFEGWKQITRALGKRVVLIGDDLFVTNTKRLEAGIEGKMANAILIKVNQIGTLTETLEAIKLAQKNKYKVIVAHRSGETNDDFIADLSVAIGSDYIKAGAPARGERVAKYNRLLAIEAQL